MKIGLIILWRIYFWFILLISIIFIAHSTPENYFDWLSKTILIVSFIGLFMFVYRKPFLSKTFWKFWFCLHMLRELYEMYFHIILKSNAPVKAVIIGIIPAFPAYLGLFLYSFHSKQIWAQHCGQSYWPLPSEEVQKSKYPVRPILEIHLFIIFILSFVILAFIKKYFGPETLINSNSLLNILDVGLFIAILPALISCFPAGIYWLFKRKLMPAFYPLIWILWIIILYFFIGGQIKPS